MRINRRLLQIATVCFIIAIVITMFMFHTVKKAAEPEATEAIAYFKYNFDKDTILKDKDIEFMQTPKSLIPDTAIKNIDEIRDKRLVIKAEAGDMILSGKLVKRGDVRVDVTKLFTIGIDMKNISNFLGGNLKEGGEYILLYITPEHETQVMSEVKIANVVDAAGRIMTENGDGVMKTVNVSVRDQETMIEIASKKDIGTFEIIDAPEGYKVEKGLSLKENIQEKQQDTIQKSEDAM